MLSESASRAAALPKERWATAEDWARAYLTTRELAHKLAPPAPPANWDLSPRSEHIAAPGRPPELRITREQQKQVSAAKLKDAEARAKLFHVFFHHELQAAELMCWALLKFADAETDFKKGLLAICLDEIRHMNLYREHIERLGYQIGDFEVRDWFWERGPTCESKLSYVAYMGLGLEAANLEHAERFTRWFELAGDRDGALIQQRVGKEEVAHVAFARLWFTRWKGELTFDAWERALPPPLSPLLMRAKPLNWEARRKAGLPEAFLKELDAWAPQPRRV